MNGSAWIVNNEHSYQEFISFVDEQYKKDKYLIFSYKSGRQRSLSQNNLFHMWVRQWAAHDHKCKPKEVTDRQFKDWKLTLKALYYVESSDDEMIYIPINMATGEPAKPQMQSTKDLSTGSMFNFMEFVQNYAAERGCVLEASGEYWDLKMSGKV